MIEILTINHSLCTYSLFSSSDVFAAGVYFFSAAQSEVDVYLPCSDEVKVLELYIFQLNCIIYLYTKITKSLCYDWSRAVQLIQHQHPVKLITLSFFGNGTSAKFIKDSLKRQSL